MITLTELRKLKGIPLRRKPQAWVQRKGPLDSPCWIWQGALTRGYPRRGTGKHNAYELVHRVHLATAVERLGAAKAGK